MKRGKKTSGAPAGAVAVGAVRGDAAEAWGRLLARAEAALDERGVEALERRRHAAEKTRRRMKERGLKMTLDLDAVKRALVAYYEDSVTGESALGFRGVFREAGVDVSDFLDGREVCVDLRTVFDYIVERRKEMTGIEAMELARQAQNSQRRLVTEEECRLNQRAVELSLKATMKDVYGDGGEEKGAEKRKPIVYKFENFSVNMIMSPAELAARKLDGATPVSEVIDA